MRSLDQGLRRLLLSGAALSLLTGLPAAAEERPLAPVSPPRVGDLLPPLPPILPKGKKPAPLNPDRILRARSGLTTPLWGNIRTFWGEVNPYWGNIRTFWGDVSPFEGNLTAFWGNIRTFNDDDPSAATPLWGNIRTFSGGYGDSWRNLNTAWDAIPTTDAPAGAYDQLAGQLGAMVQQSADFWGAAVQAKTGKSFMDGFGNKLLAEYGIDLADPQSLARLDQGARQHFFLDWYDGLMDFSGADHVDYWMKQVNWTPALTETLGGGKDAKIGLIDFKVTGDDSRNVVAYDGISEIANGHGSAVASLMVAAHDGKGVMGLAPQASVVAYNPFDASGTAGWNDIRNGIVELGKARVGVINLSLGVPNWTLNADWNTVLSDKAVRDATKNVIFVMAAGNDGIVQDRSIVWNKDNGTFLVVGSVDPTGTISSFSNRPGEACLLDGAKCGGDYLKNHFIVAPGEMILVSDGKGGVTRLSGTSFAAPMVSGTIALIQDRWPWLTDHPKDVANIILKSAKDLGAPGIDPVYGVGALDVQAAMSPLDWNTLTYKQVNGALIKDISVKDLRATSAKTRATWEPNGVYFILFEKTGESQRDFKVPMSSKLTNSTFQIWGAGENFMTYLTSGFSTWLGAPTKFAGSVQALGFASAGSTTGGVAGFGAAEASLTMAPQARRMGFVQGEVPFQSVLRVASPDGRVGFQMGNGDQAAAVGGQAGFAASSDYDVTFGGANPFVGLASGGAFARLDMRVAPRLTVSTAMTQRTLRRNLYGASAQMRFAFGGYDPYSAAAATMGVRFDASERLSTSVTYTMLHEDSAVLGMQSRDAGDLPGGSTTDAATFGADLALSPTLTLSGSATVGRTRAGDPSRANYAIAGSGLTSSAFQLGVGKQNVFDRADRLRMTFAQPMHVEGGRVDVTTVGVVDRDTGEIGAFVQNVPVATGARRYVAEVTYGRDVMDGIAQVSLFGRANLATANDPDLAPLTVGAAFRLGF
jgi:hypothetical protein